MQEVYRIDVVPSYKPWRGGGSYYVKDKEVFELFEDDAWLPDVSVSDLPDKFKYLAVEPIWDDEKECCIPYEPNGTENWEDSTAIIDGEEVELDISIRNILNDSIAIEYPLILLGSVTVYEE